MAYTSDLRGKNLLTDIDIYVRGALARDLKDHDLEFRVFDESREDALLWEDGGLCFKDPLTGNELGSNDAGWFLDREPIFIVEATFATERGQFGDGQLNRISHSLGPALNGVYGVVMVPYNGQSFSGDRAMPDIISDNIGYKKCLLRKDMVLFGLTISKNYDGKYLIMDPYEPELIADMLIAVIKSKLNMNNDLKERTELAIKKMEDFLGNHQYGARSNQTLSQVHYTDGSVSTDIARYYSHNLESLTTSQKRDGHGLLRKNLIEMYLAKDRSTAIFIRLDNNDFDILTRRRSKEFTFITTNPRIDVYNFDDLEFEDAPLRDRIIDLKNQNLHTSAEKGLMRAIQEAFNSGRIKVRKK